MASKIKLFVEHVSYLNQDDIDMLTPFFDKVIALPDKKEDIVFYIDYHPEFDFRDSIRQLSPNTLAYIKQNKSKVLILTEGFDLFGQLPEIFTSHIDMRVVPYWKILSELKSQGIGEEQLFIISGNNGYEEEIKQMASRKIKWFNSTYDVKAKFLYFNPFLTLYTKGNMIEKKPSQIKFLFSSLSNGRPSMHRYHFTKKLFDHGLDSLGKISLVRMEGPDAEFNKRLPIVYDDRHNQWRDGINENNLFTDTLLWISNETFLNNYNIKGYTEKTIKPIYYKSPFIINGCRGLLELLRQDGFQTFSKVWDESYDQMSDINDRQDRIIEVLKSLESKTFHELYDETLPVVTHNYNHLMSINAGEIINDFFTA